MSKFPLIAACMLLLGSLTSASAAPLDSPDSVTINGQPCNTACQSYMEWSRRASGQPAREFSRPIAEPLPPAAQATTTVAPKRVPVHVVTKPKPQPKSNKTEKSLTATDDVNVVQPKPAMAAPAPVDTASKSMPTLNPRPSPEAAKPPVEQVAAVPPVQDLDLAKPSAQQTTKNPPLAVPFENKSNDTAKAILPQSDPDLVAILLVREDIKSVPELADKTIAIDASQADKMDSIKNAIAKAGAKDVRVTDGEKLALGRVMDGEVPAGIVSVVSPEEAAMWSGVQGFTILRLPLGSRSKKATP
jgi:hypothetical protein